MITSLRRPLLWIMILTLTATSFPLIPVEGANFTRVSMRHSRMAQSVATSGTDPILVIMRPATTATEVSVGISFGTGYTVNATPANITVSTASLPATYQGSAVTAHPGIGSAASAVSGQNVTFASTDLTVGTTYGFYITGGITNPATTGQKVSRISTHSDGTPDFSNYTDAIDNSRVATYIVSDNGGSTDSDQIVITAKVAPTYTLILSAQAITLDTSVASVEYPGGAQNGAVSGVNATATTNANNGHIMWLKANSATGLDSATTATSIAFAGTAADATPSTLSAGTEGVVVDVDLITNTSGSLSIAAEFNGASTSAGGTPSTTFQEIASASGPVGGAGDVVRVMPRVAISTTTQSADDYTNTFTVTGAGNF
ncbi:MAG TPA: hypothetical protein PKG71_02655 [Candidatus Woesebacteria bacterium]|nr:hypothetical protein [Candidatus Woesebacteria bacterium]